MRWLLRKIDSLAGAFLAAIGGVAFAQAPVFVQQYLQRLGGHVDEARRNLVRVATEEAFKGLEPGVRLAVEAVARDRLVHLERQQQALLAADPVLRPLSFLRTFDPDIAGATFGRFEPAVPLDPAGLIYAAAGVLAVWLLYELLKTLAWLVGRLAVGQRRTRAG
jgi:hypothetical protein